jgi:hypothetical protein
MQNVYDNKTNTTVILNSYACITVGTLTLPKDHLMLTLGFKSLYGMFTCVTFYSKVQNDFVLYTC